MTKIEIKRKMAEMHAMAAVHGDACAEVWDGFSMVWLEATKTKNRRVIWTVNEKRVARADIHSALHAA